MTKHALLVYVLTILWLINNSVWLLVQTAAGSNWGRRLSHTTETPLEPFFCTSYSGWLSLENGQSIETWNTVLRKCLWLLPGTVVVLTCSKLTVEKTGTQRHSQLHLHNFTETVLVTGVTQQTGWHLSLSLWHNWWLKSHSRETTLYESLWPCKWTGLWQLSAAITRETWDKINWPKQQWNSQ